MILLHRLPVGLMLGLIGSARFKWLPWAGALWICVCTFLGFYLGESFMSALTETQEALFQSFVSGVFLHVLFAHETKVETPAEDQSSSAP
jgi:membrane protein DedA with SNARE-associated domain